MLYQWQETIYGKTILNWEQEVFEDLSHNIFGYYALQLGLTSHDFLNKNRMPYKWHAQLVEEQQSVQLPNTVDDIVLCPEYLPFAKNSVDLIVLPHTLETSDNPMQVLREVERVLVPEGRILLSCVNPWRNFTAGLQKKSFKKIEGSNPSYAHQEWLSFQRITDWLKLLGFEVELLSFGGHSPVVQSLSVIEKTKNLDRIIAKLWPTSGVVFVIQAVKRVPSIRLLSPQWQTSSKPSSLGVPVRRSVDKTSPENKINSQGSI